MNAIKLNDDPKEALREIASYLRTGRTTRDRAVMQDGEMVGYWQCGDWLSGLQEIANECDRLTK